MKYKYRKIHKCLYDDEYLFLTDELYDEFNGKTVKYLNLLDDISEIESVFLE